MKKKIALLAIAALGLQLASQPALARMTEKEREAAAVAAVAILGIAALAHHKHHYREGYEPENGDDMADFERGYRDSVHGYSYYDDNQGVHYIEGYHSGERERENSMAFRRHVKTAKAPPMAYQGCAQIVAQNFAVGPNHVHFTKAQSPGKHEWLIEAGVGHSYMVCKMRDTGELIELTGGRL